MKSLKTPSRTYAYRPYVHRLNAHVFITITLIVIGLASSAKFITSAQAQTTSAQTNATTNTQTTFALPNSPAPANEGASREINEFWEADKKQMPPTGAVLFMGSSSIKMWDTLAKDFPEIPVINRGFGGSLIEESTRYADRIIFPYKPKMIVLAAGTNDLAYGGKNPQQVFQEFKEFVAKVHGVLPDTRIVYISINPTVARWNQEADILETNHLIEEFIFKNNSPTEKLNFINSHAQLLTPDGQPPTTLLRADKLHLNAEGYNVWLSILKPRILALATLEKVNRLDEPK